MCGPTRTCKTHTWMSTRKASRTMNSGCQPAVPNDVASELQSCGNTAFRETEITIDGQPAGLAPVFPWIFTGGIDPFLWFPIPGVQTLNFTPYRVNLTPFAGLLSNGQQHTVSLSRSTTPTAISRRRRRCCSSSNTGSTKVTGAVTQNTLAGPSPVVKENLNVQPTTITGTVDVASGRSFAIVGYVNTSHGKVTTNISQSVNFSSDQSFDITASKYVQDISQETTLLPPTLWCPQPGAVSVVNYDVFTFPLTVDISEVVLSDGDTSVTTTAKQTYHQLTTETIQAGKTTYSSLHAGVGKLSFEEDKLVGNVTAFVEQIRNAKPAGVKGHYVKSITLSATIEPRHSDQRLRHGGKIESCRKPRAKA